MRWSRSALVLAGVLVVMAAVACRPIRPTGKASLNEEMPECPHAWEKRAREEGFALSGRTTDVPEFHDCQRLRIPDRGGDGARYGALAAVFAPDSANAPSTAQLRGGAVVGHVYLPEAGATYAPLAIRAQHSCLVVEHPPGSDPRAWMVEGTSDADCVDAAILTRRRPANELRVRALEPSEKAVSKSVPNVARWDWDPEGRVHYVGVRCGDRWCEIGPRAGFGSSTNYVDTEGPISVDDQLFAHKGAYDEQFLAEFPGGLLSAAGNFGTVVPTPELADFTALGAKDGEWTRVARIFMRPAAGSYTKSFNFVGFDAMPLHSRPATLSICHQDSAERCVPPEGGVIAPTLCTPAGDGRIWLARVDNGRDRPKYFCVRYREHKVHFTIPPVVRWRWRDNDETIWVSCRGGCCEVNAV